MPKRRHQLPPEGTFCSSFGIIIFAFRARTSWRRDFKLAAPRGGEKVEGCWLREEEEQATQNGLWTGNRRFAGSTASRPRRCWSRIRIRIRVFFERHTSWLCQCLCRPSVRPCIIYADRRSVSQPVRHSVSLTPPPPLLPALSNGPSVSPSGSHTASQAVRQSVTKEALEKWTR